MTEAIDPRRLGLATAVLGVLALGLVVYAAHGSMGFNAVSLPGESTVQSSAWAPEGWKFFTRSPQEEGITAYVPVSGTWTRAFTPGGAPRFLFGLDRSGRAEGMEIAKLSAGLANRAYKSCEDEPSICLAKMHVAAKVTNPSPSPKLCGEVAIVLQKPVPWAWAKSGKTITMPSRIAKLEVAC